MTSTKDFAISVNGLSKSYDSNIAVQNDTIRDELVGWVKSMLRGTGKSTRRPKKFWALKDVSLEIKEGEIAGIIGRNGAGKSTLLKVLSRITEPTSGVAHIRGRVGSLLEVGTGFHAELTGRENVYLNGAILGMKRREITRKFDEIVAFSEVEKFIDTPVKRYSSGMYLRLAFAVAVHLEPEILLLDEVIAVGDVAFQRKCLGKMGDIARQGRTILFVSHNLTVVQNLCSVAHLFDHGRLIYSGKTKDVVQQYLSFIPALCSMPLVERTDRKGNGQLRFTDSEFLTDDGSPAEVIQSGQDLQISVSYTSRDSELKNVYMAIDIFEQSGQCMLSLCNEMVGTNFETIPPSGRFSCLVERLPLSPGQYHITLFCKTNGVIADWIQQAAVLAVEPGDFFGTGRLPPATDGLFVPQDWQLEEEDNRLREHDGSVEHAGSGA